MDETRGSQAPDSDPLGTELDPDELDRMWDFADPVGSAACFEAAAADPVRSASVRAELLTQQARALGLQERFVEAAALLDGIEPTGPLLTARIELERGRLANSSGDLAAAVPHFSAARAAAELAGDEYLEVDALHMLAIADPDRAAQWTSHALSVLATGRDPRPRRWIGPLRNNLGWTLFDRGDPAGALRQFEAALEAFERDGTAEQIRIARWTVARALRELGRVEEALAIQRELLTGPEDGYVHQELAALLAQAEPAAAAEHAARATELLG